MTPTKVLQQKLLHIYGLTSRKTPFDEPGPTGPPYISVIQPDFYAGLLEFLRGGHLKRRDRRLIFLKLFHILVYFFDNPIDAVLGCDQGAR